MDFSSWKRMRWQSLKANDFLDGRSVVTDELSGFVGPGARDFSRQLLQQSHGLKELESPRFCAQSACYTRTRSLARGGHFRKGVSLLLLVRAIIFVNELIEQYSPKNRSRTQANKNNPLSTYRSSSKWISISNPRQKPPETLTELDP